jgi:ribosomal protein L11 methyltransferase
MNWLEVSFHLDGELAEAVAEMLARYAPSGVVTEHGIKFVDADDPGTPSDDVTVRAYLPADDRLEETRQRLEQSLSYLGMIQPIPAPTYTPIKDANWMEAWKQHYRPLTVGEKLIIVPAWMDSPDETRIPIKIDPGMAFGTGTHPTTQLALALMEEVIDELNPKALIDVGCGSGILSIGALKLGVDKALGVDVDMASVESSRENADVNGIGDEFIIGQGSVDEILAGNFPFKTAPLVVANILAPVLIRLTEAGMGKLVAPNGRLVLSGILEEREADIRATVSKHQLEIVERRQMGDWVAFVLIPNS